MLKVKVNIYRQEGSKPPNPAQEKWQKMDGWIFEEAKFYECEKI